MDTKEILILEERDYNNLYKINLVKEGIYLRAIDWSAYLLSLLNKDEPLSASKIKSYGITIISVGFPIISGAKYLSMFDINNIDLSQDVIVLDARDLITENFKFEDIGPLLKQWGETIPMFMPEAIAPSEITNGSDKQPENSYSFLDIMREFLSYDTSDKSASNNIAFINAMKKKILNLII